MYEASLQILKQDPKIAPLIEKFGPPNFSRHRSGGSVFQSLVRAIVYQQLSGKAASTIHGRLLALFPKGTPTPKSLLAIDPAKLRAAGVSGQKIGYLKDLAARYLDGAISEKKFPQMSSQEIIDHLVAVKGVGEWTAQMVLIFTLRRLDVLPVGDLGVRKGFQRVYRLRALPEKKKMELLAKPWRQYASIAAWYFWRVTDEK